MEYNLFRIIQAEQVYYNIPAFFKFLVKRCNEDLKIEIRCSHHLTI